MKRTKRILAIALTLTLVLAFLPITAFAAPSPIAGTITVTVTNATYEGAPADRQGEFVREEVQITPGMTVEDAINTACAQAEITIAYEYGIIQSIGGLGGNPAALASGWFCAVNNWFADTGASSILAQDGDWISVEYTNGATWDDFGKDVGSVYGDFTKTLKALDFDGGKLTPAFSPTTHAYTLTVPQGTTGVVASPLATNRNFQVKTFVEGTEYKLFDTVPVSEDSEITVICGDPEWPSMNKPDGVPAETYTLTIAYEEAVDNGGGNGDPEITGTEDDSPKTGDNNMLIPLAMLAGIAGLAGAGVALTGKRRIN